VASTILRDWGALLAAEQVEHLLLLRALARLA
jgi:hypothetical protein